MTRKKSNFIGALLFLTFGAIFGTFGSTYTWQQTSSSGWQTTSNWTPALSYTSSGGDVAKFTSLEGVNSPITVTFADNVPPYPGNPTTISAVQFEANANQYIFNFGEYALSLNAYDYMIENQSNTPQTFNVGVGKIEFWGTGALSGSNDGHLVFNTRNNSPKGCLQFHEALQINHVDITNTGGYTKFFNNVTMNDSTITNLIDSDSNNQGNLIIKGALTSTTITNNRGYTQLGDSQLADVTITNLTAEGGPAGYTLITGSVTDNGGSTFTNTALSSENRAGTLVHGSGSLAGSVITNNGGLTWLQIGGRLTSTVRNKIDGNGIPGYLAIQGGGTTWTLNNNTPLGIDINSTTNGFVFLYNNHTQNVSGGVLDLYLDTTNTYNNTTRFLIYKNNITGDADSALTGEFSTVAWYDTNGNPINVEATFNYAPTQTPPAPLGLVGNNSSVLPLLQVTFTYPPTLTDTNRGQIKSFATHNREMSRHLGLANQHIARAVMTSGEKSSSSSLYVPFLSMTGNGLQDQVAENLQKFAPRGSGNTGIWIQPFGRLISQGDQGGITGYKSKMSGLLIGGDHKINPHTMIGASLGYALSTSELNGNTGKSQIKNKLFTTFAKYNADSWYVEGILTLNKNRLRSGRVVNPTTVATSTHDGIEAIPSLGFGYKAKIAELDLIPYLTTTLLWNQEDGYVENGAGAKNLTIRKRITSQLQGEAGVNATKIHTHDFGQATYGASLGILVSTPLKKGPITGTVLGTGFGVESNDSTHTYGIAKLSSQFALEEDWYVSATLAGEFGTRYQAYEGGITFRKLI